MENEKNINSVLSMDKLLFEKIEFKRIGLKNDSQIKFELQVQTKRSCEDDIYKVTLGMMGEKKDEYTLEVLVAGFFSFESKEKLSDHFKDELISKNALAILMPYLRSQISLITAQPEVECVVLPPFNINNIVSE